VRPAPAGGRREPLVRRRRLTLIDETTCSQMNLELQYCPLGKALKEPRQLGVNPAVGDQGDVLAAW
jgi:hypothetical protein